MRSFFTEIALVNSAARLAGRSLIDNYAIFGAMQRYRDLELGEIKTAEGIDDVPEKADSFRFGTVCGRVLAQFTSSWADADWLRCDAQAARIFFLPGIHPENGRTEQDRELLFTVFRALVKRAQIRTHTAKPGYEDINTWLERYYRLSQEYQTFLPSLVDAIVSPEKQDLEKAEKFLSPADSLIQLASSTNPASQDALSAALQEESRCIFGEILRQILMDLS